LTRQDHVSYLFLHGLSVPKVVKLSDSIELLPASGIASPDVALTIAKTAEDKAALLLFLPRISSELRITASTKKALAIAVWNAGWDALLLGAILGFQVEQNIESESSASEVTSATWMRVTNYHFHGWHVAPRKISAADCQWLASHFSKARGMLDNEVFRSSVHCLSSCYWHPHPRPRLALVWAGIEALFNIESELSFRLSLLAARFLEPDDRAAAQALFRRVKQLYTARSRAVHGGTMKGDAKALIVDSASLLHRLLRRCVESGSLPDSEALVL